MDRRAFLSRLGLLTAAAVILDPAELIERLAPRRLYVPGADFTPSPAFMRSLKVPPGQVFVMDSRMSDEVDAMMHRLYTAPMAEDIIRESVLLTAFANYDPAVYRARTRARRMRCA